MHSSFTNRGKKLVLDMAFRDTAIANLYVALVTDATKPTPDINTLGELDEIPQNDTTGYREGGFQLSRDATDFDDLTEDDTEDRARVQIKDVSWTHATETILLSGKARYAVLTDFHATPGSRQVIAYWDLMTDRSVVAGDILLLQDLTLRIEEVL